MDFTAIFIAFMVVLFYAIGIFILAAGIKEIRIGFAARNWPTVDASLQKCVVERPPGSSNVVYHLAVKYVYVVAGTRFTGDTLAIGYGASSDRAPHETARQELLGMKRFVVRYDPDRPEVSTVYASENALIFGLAVFGLLWLAFTTCFAVIVLAISGIGLTDLLEWIPDQH